jgi:hypothetical protein
MHLVLHEHSDDDQDRHLDASILQFTHAIFLPFDSSAKSDEPNPILAFFFLTEALFLRLPKYPRLSDVNYCVNCFRYLRDLSPEAFGFTCNKVTIILVHILSLQIKLEPGNAMKGIEEMSVLCQELLALDLSETDRNRPFLASLDEFAANVVTHFRAMDQPSQQVVECLRQANARLPDSRLISLAIFMSLYSRFFATMSNDDYEDAMTFFDKDFVPHSIRDSPNPYLRQVLILAGEMANLQFGSNGNPKSLEQAIVRFRSCLDSVSPNDPERGAIIQSLAELERRCLDVFGITSGLPEVDLHNPKVDDLPSLSQLAASLSGSNNVKMTMVARALHFRALSKFTHCLTNKEDVEEGAKYSRLLLTSLQQSPDEAMITYAIIACSGWFFYRAFELTNDTKYLLE